MQLLMTAYLRHWCVGQTADRQVMFPVAHIFNGCLVIVTMFSLYTHQSFGAALQRKDRIVAMVAVDIGKCTFRLFMAIATRGGRGTLSEN